MQADDLEFLEAVCCSMENTRKEAEKTEPKPEDLFLRNIQQCYEPVDVADALTDQNQKKSKQTALKKMIAYITTNPSSLTESVYPEIVNMFAMNVFRVLPPPTIKPDPEFGSNWDEENEPTHNATRPHQPLVYDFFLHFLESSNFNDGIAARYIRQQFVLRIVELFDSEDSQERAALQMTLHRIYQKLRNLRTFIRKEISNVFCTFIHETQRHNGIAELLECLVSIVHGFSVPLREEHEIFLLKVLLPLHKARSLSAYQPQLTCCVTQFLAKDRSLTEPVILGLLKFWPRFHTMNEVLFLYELEVVLEVVDPAEFQKVIVPVFHQLAKCTSSPHMQVSERALKYCANKILMFAASNNAAVVFPIILPVVRSIFLSHWSKAIQELADCSLKRFLKIDRRLFHECLMKSSKENELKRKNDIERDRRWQQLERRAQRNSSVNFHSYGEDMDTAPS